MTLVPDAGLVVTALVEPGEAGEQAGELLLRGPLAAPYLLHAEVANVLRRHEARGELRQHHAERAHSDMLDLRMAAFGYAPFARRIWELRATITPYDAWYVAVAEALEAPLATVDARLSRAPGPRCEFIVLARPPEA